MILLSVHQFFEGRNKKILIPNGRQMPVRLAPQCNVARPFSVRFTETLPSSLLRLAPWNECFGTRTHKRGYFIFKTGLAFASRRAFLPRPLHGLTFFSPALSPSLFGRYFSFLAALLFSSLSPRSSSVRRRNGRNSGAVRVESVASSSATNQRAGEPGRDPGPERGEHDQLEKLNYFLKLIIY